MKRLWVPEYGIPVNTSSLTPNTRGNKGQPTAASHLHHVPTGLNSLTSIADIGGGSTAETQVLSTTIDGTLLQAGDCIDILIWGQWVVQRQPSIAIKLRIGTTTLTGTILASTTVFTSTGASAFYLWRLAVDFYSVGVSGSVAGALSFRSNMASQVVYGSVLNAPGSATTVDTTSSSLLIEATVQWTSSQAADAGNHFYPSVGTVFWGRAI